MTMKTKTVIPCGKVLDAFWSTPDKQVVTRICGEDGVYCEYCMIEYGKLYLAESDQTPADRTWLESQGWTHIAGNEMRKGRLQMMWWSSGIQGLNIIGTHAIERLVVEPTRGAVLKILAGIGGGGC